MKRFKSIKLVVAAFLILAAYTLPTLPANAQSDGSSASLSIAPKKNYVIEPGKSVDDTLMIRNIDSTSSLQLNLRVVDFSYTDSTGTPKLLLDPNAAQTTWSAKPFLKVPKSVNIEPGGTAVLDISAAVPANQGAGSYYSAIVYSTGAPDGGNVGLAASGVTLAFISIPGQVSEDLTLKKFGLFDPQSSGSDDGFRMFTGNDPTTMGYSLENKGNVTESPVGSIKLKDIFGRETVISNINPNGSLALIGQTRTFSACIKVKETDTAAQGTTARSNTCESAGLWPGLYTASIDIFYGQNGNITQEIHKSGFFWYLPLWFIVVLVLLLLVIGFFIFKIVRKIKGSQQGKIRMPSRRRK